MKKYVTHRCGHTSQVEVCGPNRDRERKIAYYESCDCPDCRKQQEMQTMQDKGYTIRDVLYRDYKSDPYYTDCKTVSDSYNPETKTIQIYYPACLDILRD